MLPFNPEIPQVHTVPSPEVFYLSPETHSLSSAMTHLQNVNALHNSSTPTLRSFPECSIPSPDAHFTSRRTSNPEVPHCFQKYSSILLKHSTSRGALQLISRKAPFSEILRLAILGMQKSLILKQNKTKKSISRRIRISLSNVPLFHLQKLPPPENAFRVVSRDILALEPFHFLSGNMKAKPLALTHMLKELRPFPLRSPEKRLYRLPLPSLWFLETSQSCTGPSFPGAGMKSRAKL